MSVTLCTMIDAALIGNYVGSNGLAAASIVTPIFMIYALLGVTIGVGASVLIGRALGESDINKARGLMANQLFLGLGLGAFLLGVSLVFKEHIFTFLGARGELLPLVSAYLIPVFVSAPLFLLYHILSMAVRTDADAKLAAAAAGVVITVNLALDFLFMGHLNWGIKGASISLCIAEGLGVVLLLTHFFKKISLLRLRLLAPRLSQIKAFIANGFGIGSAYVFQAAVMLVFNKLLLADPEKGISGVAIFGVLYTVSTIPFAFFDGAGGAFAPVISIFSGERDGDSMLTVFRQGLKITMGVTVAVVAVFYLFPEPIMGFFGLDIETLTEGILAFRIFALSFVFSGINTLLTAFWQTIGRSHLAAILSVMRNFVLMLGAGFYFIPRFQIIGLAWTYVCSEALCLFAAAAVFAVSSSKAYIETNYSPSGRVFERFYEIRTESVAEITADLEALCDDWEVGTKETFFLSFIAEEMLLNTIKFGLADGEGDHYIDIKVLESADGYIVRIRDDVKTYNPLSGGGDEVDDAVLTLIRKKTKYCEYQRKLIFNYLYLII